MNAMTMAHTGAQMLVVNKADPKLITPDGVYAFAVAVIELERQRDELLATLKGVEFGADGARCPSCGARRHVANCALVAAIAKAEGKAP